MIEAWRVARYRFRATFGRQWGGLLAIVVLIGLLGGLAIGAVAGARRTQSSFPAYLAHTNVVNLTVGTALDVAGRQQQGVQPGAGREDRAAAARGAGRRLDGSRSQHSATRPLTHARGAGRDAARGGRQPRRRVHEAGPLDVHERPARESEVDRRGGRVGQHGTGARHARRLGAARRLLHQRSAATPELLPRERDREARAAREGRPEAGGNRRLQHRAHRGRHRPAR